MTSSPQHEPEPDTQARPFLSLVASLVGPDHDAPEADEQTFRTFIEALGVAVYTTDAVGQITFYNDAAVHLWGRRPELGELWCGSWRLFWPDGRPMAHGECPMAIALRENRIVRGVQARAQRPDGKFVDFEPYPTPLLDTNGALVGAVNVLVDVTDRRRAEDELRTTAEALAAANAVKDEFLGLVSHELRTPVTTIYGNAELLRDRMHKLSATERMAMVGDIAEDADRLEAMVENLLLFSRLQSGYRVEFEPYSVDHVVREEVRVSSKRHPKVAIRVTSESGESAVVEADRSYLRVLIQNLLRNAITYGGTADGVDLEIRAGADIEVRVLDRGIGLGPGDTAELFQPLFRAGTSQPAARGLGLGLPVSKRIVEALGGSIWASQRDGGGSEFGFAIPRASASVGVD